MSRLQAWTLESRTRYALVWGGINAAVLGGLMFLLATFGDTPNRFALEFTALALVISPLAQGFIWYPRAKRRLTTQAR